MLKKSKVKLLLAFFILLASTSAYSQTNWYAFSGTAGVEFCNSDLRWRISGKDEKLGNFISELLYETDSPRMVLKGEMVIFPRKILPAFSLLPPRISAELTYKRSMGFFSDQHGNDTDWFTDISPDPAYYGELYKLKGYSRLWNVTLYFRTLSMFLSRTYFYTDFLIGYRWQKEKVTMTNCTYYIEDYTPVYDKLSELDSTYKASFNNFAIGGRVGTILPFGLGINLKGAYFPSGSAKAKGYWNLRDMHFAQKGRNEHGYELEASLFYTVILSRERPALLKTNVGVFYEETWQKGGTDTTSGITSRWDKAISRRKGIFITVRIEF